MAKHLYHKIEKKEETAAKNRKKFRYIGKNGPKSSQKQGIYFL